MRHGNRRVTAKYFRAALMGVFFVSLSACDEPENVIRLAALPVSRAASPEMADKVGAELSPRLLRRFSPIPLPQVGSDSERVQLGRMLFFDPRISRTGKISCNSCHPLEQ